MYAGNIASPDTQPKKPTKSKVPIQQRKGNVIIRQMFLTSRQIIREAILRVKIIHRGANIDGNIKVLVMAIGEEKKVLIVVVWSVVCVEGILGVEGIEGVDEVDKTGAKGAGDCRIL